MGVTYAHVKGMTPGEDNTQARTRAEQGTVWEEVSKLKVMK